MRRLIRNPTFWKSSGACLLILGVIALSSWGESVGFDVNEQAPLFALMATTAYAVALIPSRPDPWGRLVNLAAQGVVILALLQSAISWMVADGADDVTTAVGGLFAGVTIAVLGIVAAHLIQEAYGR